ncbi:MAG: hypothetical protein Q9169_005367, partial [Polycauliona sp. 2 TL-2023]
ILIAIELAMVSSQKNKHPPETFDSFVHNFAAHFNLAISSFVGGGPSALHKCGNIFLNNAFPSFSGGGRPGGVGIAVATGGAEVSVVVDVDVEDMAVSVLPEVETLSFDDVDDDGQIQISVNAKLQKLGLHYYTPSKSTTPGNHPLDKRKKRRVVESTHFSTILSYSGERRRCCVSVANVEYNNGGILLMNDDGSG